MLYSNKIYCSIEHRHRIGATNNILKIKYTNKYKYMKFGKIWNITQWLSVDDQRNVLLKQLVLICRSIESVSGLMQREREMTTRDLNHL